MGIRRPSKKLLLKRSISINDYIRVSPLRVLSDEGEQIGILTKEEALLKARTEGLDLVLVTDKANPPIARIINFNRYLYLLAKKDKGEKKGKTDIKELKIGLFMGESDKNRIVARAAEFIKEGHQVKLSMWLKGRELGKVYEAKASFMNFLSKIDRAKVMAEPNLQGKVLRAVISFDKTKHGETKN